MNIHAILKLLGVNGLLCANEIKTNKLRSFITSLGLFMGITALLVNIAFIRAMDNDLKKNLEQMGGLNILTIAAKTPANHEERLTFGRAPKVQLSDGQKVVERVPYIRATLPQRDLRFAHLRYGGKETGGRVKAVTELFCDAYNYTAAQGRTFSSVDIHEKKMVCMIGLRASNQLFGKGVNPVGKKIMVGNYSFVVIGRIDSPTEFDWRAREVLIPYPVSQEKFTGRFGGSESVALLLTSADDIARAKIDVDREMFVIHRGIRNYEVTANDDKLVEMRSAALGMKILLGSIAFITLLVGGVSIMNIMFATIGDRIREIGVRKALGARNNDIFVQFLFEAVLLCVVGAVPAMAIGSLVIMIPPGTFPFVPTLTAFDYGIAVMFTIVVGLCAGLFPAMRAANMQPVEALQY